MPLGASGFYDQSGWFLTVHMHCELTAGDFCFRIRISGATPLWRELSGDDDQDHLREELVYRLGLLDLTLEVGSVHPQVRADDHVKRADVLGEALRLVSDIRGGGANLADLSPEELIGLDEPARLHEYVAELLDTGEAEVLSRMLKGLAEDR